MVVRGRWQGTLPDVTSEQFRPFHIPASPSVESKHVDVAELGYGDARWAETYEQVERWMLAVNEMHFRMVLTGWQNHIRVNRAGPGDHFGWHADYGEWDDTKLSFDLCIEAADEGGELYVLDWDPSMGEDPDAPVIRLEPGEWCIFGGNFPHRQAPVVSGRRIHLLGWLNGPRFV